MKKYKNIILLGHGYAVKVVIETINLHFKNYKVPLIVTHPKQDHFHDQNLVKKRKAIYGKYSFNVFNAKKKYGIEVMECEDVNMPECISKISNHDPELIISIGCRNIIKKNFLKKFKNSVINIHTTPLPKYRGAASDSWMILNNENDKKLFGCIHFIDIGIDTGDIIAKEAYSFPRFSYPIDVYKKRMDTVQKLLLKALPNLTNKSRKWEVQEVESATSFPRLSTPNDGKIDFIKFSGIEIERFIYAFGYPFEGAHCFIDNKKINILDSEFFEDIEFHSFSHGLIFGKNGLFQYKVSVRGGYLLIKKIEVDGVLVENNKVLRIGKFLK